MPKLGNIQKFTQGQTSVVNRQNETIHTVNFLMRKPQQDFVISRRRGGGGGVSPVIWAEVIRRPMYADPEGEPAEGYSDYVLRLDSSSYTVWSEGVYPVDTLRTKDGLLYKSNQETSSAWVDEEWDLQPEINPKHFDYDAVDWRHFSPWFREGRTVPLIKKGSDYYFWHQPRRVKGVDTFQSIIWNDEDDREMAVFA